MRAFHSIFIALLLLSPCFAYAGEALMQIEKKWHISSNDTIYDVNLDGSFLVENEFQEILELSLSDDGAEFIREGQKIKVAYSAKEFFGSKEILASARVRVSYPIGIEENPPLERTPLPSPGLSHYNEEMLEAASSVSAGSRTQLEAVAALASHVHKYVEYDLSYWGHSSPAEYVFHAPRAVCIGYTHLFIAMARSQGLESRFVSGYAFSGEWQPHAWAEVRIGDRWVHVDPTFQEVGALDARHIQSSYADDNTGIFDVLSAKGEGFSFNSTVSVKLLEKKVFPQEVFAHTVLQDNLLKVVVHNPTPLHATPTFAFSLPDSIHPGETRVLTIPPESSKALIYELRLSSLKPGFSHRIPYSIRMQGTDVSENLVVYSGPAGGESEEEYFPPLHGPEPCPLLSFLLLLTFAAAFSSRRRSH